MMIDEKTTFIKPRHADCFVLDYDRLLPTGWPLLVPVEMFTPHYTNRNAVNSVDRIQALKLLRDGLKPAQIAERLGCHRTTVGNIRAAAAEAARMAER